MFLTDLFRREFCTETGLYDLLTGTAPSGAVQCSKRFAKQTVYYYNTSCWLIIKIKVLISFLRKVMRF